MKITTKIVTLALIGVVGSTGYLMIHDQHPKLQATPSYSKSTVLNQKQPVTVTQSKTDTSQDPKSPVEGSYPIIASQGVFIQYNSLAELYKEADIVAEVKVIDQDIVPIDFGTVSTRSQVQIKQMFKGDPGITTLRVTESGGLIDFSKVPDLNKPGKGHEPKNPGIVDTAFEGSPVMKKNQTYIVFLSENPNQKWGYNIVGSVQGKLKIDGDSGKIVNTVDSHYVDEKAYFLQRQFAGRNKSDVIAALQSLQ